MIIPNIMAKDNEIEIIQSWLEYLINLNQLCSQNVWLKIFNTRQLLLFVLTDRETSFIMDLIKLIAG